MHKTFHAAPGREDRRTPSPADPLATEQPLADDLASEPGTLTDPLAAAPLRLKAVSAGPPEDPDRHFDEATRGSSGPVPYQSEMEQAFSTDFGGVRAHVGADLSALGAEAAARGDTVAFRDTHPSRETVAHELAHVVQARSGGAAPGIAAPGSTAEQEADDAARAVVSGGTADVGAGPGGAIQLRTLSEGNQTVTIPDHLSKEAFRKRTYVWFASRGDHLTRIEDFLGLVQQATTFEDLRWATTQAVDAINAWLDKHAQDDSRSVEARREPIRAFKQDLNLLRHQIPNAGGSGQGPAQGTSQPSTPSYATAAGSLPAATNGPEERDEGYDGNEGLELAKGLAGDVAATPLGVPGAGADIHGTRRTSYGDLNDKATFGMAEGSANVVSGLLDFGGGIHQMKTGRGGVEKAKGGLNATGGFAKAAGGLMKIASSAEKHLDPGDSSAGELTGRISDGALGTAAGIGAVVQLTDFAASFRGVTADWASWSIDQQINFVLDRGKNLIGAAQGVADSINGFTKMATTAANTTASTVSGALGVATGGIDVLKGGFDLAKAGVRRGELTKLQTRIDEVLAGLSTQIDQDVPRARRRLRSYIAELKWMRLTAKDKVSKANFTRILDSYAAKEQELDDLLAELTQKRSDLLQARQDLTPHIEAMRKVQKRSQKNAAFKMATGAIDVVTGALVLSGVGAPVAIGLAAFNGLLRLGNAALDAGRKWKASKLGELAQRIDSSGRILGRADPQEVGYREMERRIEKAYYRNYDAAIDGTTRPPGFSDGEWGDVRDFVQDAKSTSSTMDHGDRQGAKAAGSTAAARDHWGQFTEGSKTYKEKPSGFRKVELFFTFDAHKSEQAIDASNSELAQAVIDIAMGSFDPTTRSFVPTQVTTQDPAKGIRAMAAKVMLSNVGVSEKTWIAMWRRNGGWFANDDDGQGGRRPDTRAPNRDALEKDVKRKIEAL